MIMQRIYDGDDEVNDVALYLEDACSLSPYFTILSEEYRINKYIFQDSIEEIDDRTSSSSSIIKKLLIFICQVFLITFFSYIIPY